MRYLLLDEIWMYRHFFKMRKYGMPRKIWHCVHTTMNAENYKKSKKYLDESGLDYRIRLNPNHKTLVFLRKELSCPERFRMWYGFYVTRRDYDRAREIMKLDPPLPFFGMRVLL